MPVLPPAGGNPQGITPLNPHRVHKTHPFTSQAQANPLDPPKSPHFHVRYYALLATF